MAAGRVMLVRLAKLTRAGETFAFETTLAGRGMRGVLRRCLDSGYRVHVVFLWLPSADVAAARVRRRVELGGHDVPESDIRHRFERGLVNFFDIYRSLSTTWRLFDASGPMERPMIAYGRAGSEPIIVDATLWAVVQEQLRETRERAEGRT